MGTKEDAAEKVLEEAAEVFGSWQHWAEYAPLSACHERGFPQCNCPYTSTCDTHQHPESMDTTLEQLADEIADCIQACANLAARYDLPSPHIDVPRVVRSDKTLALSPLFAAAHVLCDWEILNDAIKSDEHDDFSRTYIDSEKETIGEDIESCIAACITLARLFDIDLAAAMARCEERNRLRGRYEKKSEDVESA